MSINNGNRKGIFLGNQETPCRHCKDRYVGCHGVCAKYIEYDLKNKKRLEENFRQAEHKKDLEVIKSIGVKRSKNSYYCTGHKQFTKSRQKYEEEIRKEVYKNAL